MKLTRNDIIKQFADKYGIDISNGLRVTTVDHTKNPIAPEETCYKISYICKLINMRRKCAYWPKTVGFQYYK